MIKTVICEICTTPIATVDLDELAVPMTPGMFKSLDASRGIPAPFREFQDFLSFRCRQCKARPFMFQNQITVLNDKGFRQEVNIDKLYGDRKAREANQEKINELFQEEEGFVRGLIASVTNGGDRLYRCKCGAEYKHQSSLIRHRKACNAG